MRPTVDAPNEPVIPESECYAAFLLIRHMVDNIVERGDVPKDILDATFRLADTLPSVEYPASKDADAIHDAIKTGLLPTFHHGSSEKVAGAALLRLITANANSYHSSCWWEE